MTRLEQKSVDFGKEFLHFGTKSSMSGAKHSMDGDSHFIISPIYALCKATAAAFVHARFEDTAEIRILRSAISGNRARITQLREELDDARKGRNEKAYYWSRMQAMDVAGNGPGFVDAIVLCRVRNSVPADKHSPNDPEQE